ncbi:MAG: hypothetical protein CMC86_07615 [Flavobacteriaceae bacterium]|nr:hypothetical protein [Flavobacteriaceae bacterium]|tara:strand:- start:5911 stop:6879 length:969 start_codon:yes stop_codon:yes gene_type:complete
MLLNKYLFIYIFSFIIFLFIYALLGKTFDLNIWNQVFELRNVEDPLYFLININAFTIRFVFLTFPLFFLERLSGLNSEVSFHFLCMILTLLSAFFLSKITKDFFKNNSLQIDITSILFLFGLAYFANGRLLYAILGIFILFYVSISLKRQSVNKNFFLLSIGLFAGNILSNVSSGTASFAMALTIMTLFSGLFHKASRFFSILHIFLFAFPGFYLFKIYLEKNLSFYDWDFIKMLDHGLGRYIEISNEVIFLLSVIAFFLFFLIFRNLNSFLNFNKFSLLLFYFFTALVIGLFGYSAMLPMMLITFFLISWDLFFQYFNKKI